ncbi:hypothetical protein [Methylobacterium sp. Leaf108]|uniref:hypothetical protein n=1 Tax=Methylobacterium sp. Leaf108 TaxID=1736256 RepID=UPI0006F21425|nr:hypothetical protein [Methylobacterium sp. Leaf108]KQP61067.1 hypothetical protein ASF39_15440 [Methylobacterium sp. Leaf108]
MRRPLATIALGAAIIVGLAAQSSYEPWRLPNGQGLVGGNVLFCATGAPREAAPCGGPLTPLTVLSTPFVRSGTGDPIIFDGITTTAKQFAITKPADATSYRFVNPCNVDVRIRKVGSMQESVTLTTGTRFLARSSETLGTSTPAFVSLIATATPTTECNPELQYGRGG